MQNKSDLEDNVRKRMYVYVGLGHFAVQQKLTEHCKSTIILKILIIILKIIQKLQMKKTHVNC